MAQKFILQGDSLRISASVDFHRELVQRSEPSSTLISPFAKKHVPSPVKGGGWWHVDKEEKYLLLYSLSEEFGAAKLDDIIAACPQTFFSMHWNGFNVYYSAQINLEHAILDKTLIHTIER